MANYTCTPRDITVSVDPQYLEDRSRPDESYFVWAYTITIENGGDETVTLKTRYWRIVDAMGRVQEVRGAGVVGEQPTLEPGDSFQYTSGAPLSTPSGFMSGAYRMETDQGEPFDVEIPAFALDRPDQLHRIH